jgi:hypothetical protein
MQNAKRKAINLKINMNINKKKLVSEKTRNIIFNSSFEPLFDNFYLSNIISQNSVIMGKCSNTFKKRSSFII